MTPLSVRLEDLVEEQLSGIQRTATTSNNLGSFLASGMSFNPKNPSMAYSEAHLFKKLGGCRLYSLRMWEQRDGLVLLQKFLEFQRLTEDIAIALYSTLQEPPQHVLMQLPVKDFRFGFDSLPEIMIVGYTPETEHVPPLLGAIILPLKDKTALALSFRYPGHDFRVLKAPRAGPKTKFRTTVPKVEYVSVLQNPDIVVKDINDIAKILGMEPLSVRLNLPQRHSWLFVNGWGTTLGLLERFAYQQTQIPQVPLPAETRQRILNERLYRLQEYEKDPAGFRSTPGLVAASQLLQPAYSRS